MKSATSGSQSRRARRPGWWICCARLSGSRLRRRMRIWNANSVTSQRAGRRNTGSWPCALRKREEVALEEAEQYQLFETSLYKCRVFVTDFTDPIYFVVWFYNQRAGAENLIKEANNDAGLTAHPSGRFDVNSNHFQLAILAYNLNCWLMLFNREPQADATALQHTTLATARLRFLFVAAKIWRHAGRTGVSYSDHYEEKGVSERLMTRLRKIAPGAQSYARIKITYYPQTWFRPACCPGSFPPDREQALLPAQLSLPRGGLWFSARFPPACRPGTASLSGSLQCLPFSCPADCARRVESFLPDRKSVV